MIIDPAAQGGPGVVPYLPLPEVEKRRREESQPVRVSPAQEPAAGSPQQGTRR